MRIHIHTPAFFPKLVGMTFATDGHARLLADLGATVTGLAPGRDPGEGADTHSGPYTVKHFALTGSGLPWSPLTGDIDGLMEFTEAEAPDIVIAEGWYTPGANLLPKLKRHARHVVLASHGAADLSFDLKSPARLARSLVYQMLDLRSRPKILRSLSAALILSHYELNDRFADVAIFRKQGIPTFLCPNFSTYEPVNCARDMSKMPKLLHVGEMMPNKRQLLGVETLAALPSNFSLTFAYPHETPYAEHVKRQVAALGLTGRVNYIVGRNRDELESVYDAADLLLILSKSEAQPIVAIDAMSKAIPFVSTNVGCMSEFDGGLVATPEAFVAAINRIFSDSVTYSQFSALSKQYHDDNLKISVSKAAVSALLNGLSR